MPVYDKVESDGVVCDGSLVFFCRRWSAGASIFLKRQRCFSTNSYTFTLCFNNLWVYPKTPNDFLTILMPCRSQCNNMGYRPLISIQLHLVLPSPPYSSYIWNLLSTFFLMILSRCSLVALFLSGLAVSTVVPVWQCFITFSQPVQRQQ